MASGSHTSSNKSPSTLDLCEVEEFRSTVWGDNHVFKTSRIVDVDGKPYSFDYLDFGNHSLALQTLCPLMKSEFMIVRDEYRLAMEALTKEEYQDGAVVLGQPGIGKTFFLIYALVERLRKKQPTAFQYFPSIFLLFTENGVTTHSTDDIQALKVWHGIWALSDSNLDTIWPAIAFRSTPNVCTIQATSPDAKRWKEWRKQHRACLYIMDNWTVEELSALAAVSALDVDRMGDLARQWGPSPRHLLDIFKGKWSESESQEQIDSSALDFVSNARQVISSLHNLDLPLGKTGPSALIFIRPKRDKSKGFLRRHCDLYVPTGRLNHAIIRALLTQESLTRLHFFSATSSHASMRGAAGYIFEQWVHARFLSGVRVSCTWLNSESKSLPRILAAALPSKLITTNDALKTEIPPFYWRPVSINFPGVDGLLCRGNDVYAIQCTISATHRSPLDSLRRLQEIIGKEGKISWRVLFVGSSTSQATKAAKPHTMIPESRVPSTKRTRGTPQYIPVGICELPIILESYKKEVSDEFERLEPNTSHYHDCSEDHYHGEDQTMEESDVGEAPGPSHGDTSKGKSKARGDHSI
ncbi:hypothetical protein BU15DRAFT_75695 [Melanogaster broomeanus]|nr:hypothetical protein BU15DRAFT_75695 [Melanogaster broomeanus]